MAMDYTKLREEFDKLMSQYSIDDLIHCAEEIQYERIISYNYGDNEAITSNGLNSIGFSLREDLTSPLSPYDVFSICLTSDVNCYVTLDCSDASHNYIRLDIKDKCRPSYTSKMYTGLFMNELIDLLKNNYENA